MTLPLATRGYLCKLQTESSIKIVSPLNIQVENLDSIQLNVKKPDSIKINLKKCEN